MKRELVPVELKKVADADSKIVMESPLLVVTCLYVPVGRVTPSTTSDVSSVVVISAPAGSTTHAARSAARSPFGKCNLMIRMN